jgi:ATP-dependent DNA ligase
VRPLVLVEIAPFAATGASILARTVAGRRLIEVSTTDRIAQQVIGSVDARHAPGQSIGLGSIAGRPVRVMLAGKFAPAPLDGGTACLGRNVKLAVGVAAKCWLSHPTVEATTLAGCCSYSRTMAFQLPFQPPLEPMLARLADAVPDDEGYLYEPKWDGFRAIVFRDGQQVFIQSRDLRPLDRYFPELPPALREHLPERCVVDGEIVIPGPDGLDFEALLLRIHPAASRVAMLAQQTPAAFVAWDLLALGDDDLRGRPQAERRALIERALAAAEPPVHLTPATRDANVARDWFERFEGAGLDGVIAKPLELPYQPGKRALAKIKHARTADCVVAGFRWHKNGPGTHVGSLLLGLYDDEGRLHHVGVTASFAWPRRAELASELEPLRDNARDGHPWAEWADWSAAGTADASGTRLPGATSRWNRGKNLSWEPLRIERVCEVGYDHLQGDRFRHATTFRRWRPDKQPVDCRYDQLETRPAYELARIFTARSSTAEIDEG